MKLVVMILDRRSTVPVLMAIAIMHRRPLGGRLTPLP